MLQCLRYVSARIPPPPLNSRATGGTYGSPYSCSRARTGAGWGRHGVSSDAAQRWGGRGARGATGGQGQSQVGDLVNFSDLVLLFWGVSCIWCGFFFEEDSLFRQRLLVGS